MSISHLEVEYHIYIIWKKQFAIKNNFEMFIYFLFSLFLNFIYLIGIRKRKREGKERERI